MKTWGDIAIEKRVGAMTARTARWVIVGNHGTTMLRTNNVTYALFRE
jgi:hypothetical protein